MVFGFFFGIIISIIALLGFFPLESFFIWQIPLFTAVLCGIGSMAALGVQKFFRSRYLMKEKTINIIGFITAALVNTFIALIIASYYLETILLREIIILYVIGIGLGGIYGVYRYRIEQLNERMRFFEELAEKNRQLQDASRQLTLTKERNRMGRELHDSISQGLHGLVFAIHSLRNTIKDPSEDVLNIIDHMEATASSTLEELRTMIEELKPSLLTEKGLEEALKTTASLFSQRQKIPVQLTLELPESITPEQEMAIFRISQEALANIERHSGAQHVVLNIYSSKNDIVLNIKDDGKGFNLKAPPSGHGLKNMRQRAEETDGSLQVISKPGLGTSITASFPSKG